MTQVQSTCLLLSFIHTLVFGLLLTGCSAAILCRLLDSFWWSKNGVWVWPKPCYFAFSVTALCLSLLLVWWWQNLCFLLLPWLQYHWSVAAIVGEQVWLEPAMLLLMYGWIGRTWTYFVVIHVYGWWMLGTIVWTIVWLLLRRIIVWLLICMAHMDH